MGLENPQRKKVGLTLLFTNVHVQKTSMLPSEKGLEFPGSRWGVLKTKKFKQMFEA